MLNLVDSALPRGVGKDLDAIVYALATEGEDARAIGLRKWGIGVVGHGGQGKHLYTVLGELLLQVYVACLASVVDDDEGDEQYESDDDYTRGADEHEADVAMAQGAVVEMELVFGMYAIDLGTALHVGDRVEQGGVVFYIKGYGVGHALCEGELDKLVVGVAIGIYIASREQGELEVMVCRVGLP